MAFKPANNIQDLQYFGEFGGVNPSISDSSTYTFPVSYTHLDVYKRQDITLAESSSLARVALAETKCLFQSYESAA